MKDKYKIERRVKIKKDKDKKTAKKNLASGRKPPKTKDPGIPNSWPFKEQLLQEVEEQRLLISRLTAALTLSEAELVRANTPKKTVKKNASRA